MKPNFEPPSELRQGEYKPLGPVLPPLVPAETDDTALAACYRIAKERARQRRAGQLPPALPSIHTPEESPHNKDYHQFSKYS